MVSKPLFGGCCAAGLGSSLFGGCCAAGLGSSLSSIGPVANSTDVLQPIGLLYSPYPPRLFGCSHVRRQVPPMSTTMREILVAKGGTVWVRIDR